MAAEIRSDSLTSCSASVGTYGCCTPRTTPLSRVGELGLATPSTRGTPYGENLYDNGEYARGCRNPVRDGDPWVGDPGKGFTTSVGAG